MSSFPDSSFLLFPMPLPFLPVLPSRFPVWDWSHKSGLIWCLVQLEEWKAEAGGVNEAMEAGAGGLETSSGVPCQSAADPLLGFPTSSGLMFSSLELSSYCAHQDEVPEETARNLIWKGHSHPLNFFMGCDQEHYAICVDELAVSIQAVHS